MSQSAMRVRRSRKHRYCAQDFAHDRNIRPGDLYGVFTDFPGSDVGYGTYAGHPVQMAFCRDCSGHEAAFSDYETRIRIDTSGRWAG